MNSGAVGESFCSEPVVWLISLAAATCGLCAILSRLETQMGLEFGLFLCWLEERKEDGFMLSFDCARCPWKIEVCCLGMLKLFLLVSKSLYQGESYAVEITIGWLTFLALVYHWFHQILASRPYTRKQCRVLFCSSPRIFHRSLEHLAPKSAKELFPLSRSPVGGDGDSGKPFPMSQNVAVLSVKAALVRHRRATDESDCTVRSLDN